MQFIEFLKDIINVICDPKWLITIAAIALFASLKWPEKFYSDKAAKILFGVMIGFFLVSLFDADFRKVVTKRAKIRRRARSSLQCRTIDSPPQSMTSTSQSSRP